VLQKKVRPGATALDVEDATVGAEITKWTGFGWGGSSSSGRATTG